MSMCKGARIMLQLLLSMFLLSGASTAYAKAAPKAKAKHRPTIAVPLPKPRPHFVDMTVPLNCLARAVYVEARGEQDEGQLMVAYVIYYRTLLDLPGTGGRELCKAIYTKAQIDGIKGAVWAPDDERAWDVALAAADEVLYRGYDPGGELHYATHYLRAEQSGAKGKAWFDAKVKPIGCVGKHLFSRLPLPYETPSPSYACATQFANR